MSNRTLNLTDDNRVNHCTVSKEFAQISRKYWEKAGVTYRFDLRLVPAIETLNQLLAERQAKTFDFAFIDTERENYLQHYKLVLQLIRPGGTIAIAYTRRAGKIIDAETKDDDNAIFRAFDRHLDRNSISLTLLTIADGLTLVRKQ